MLGPQRQSRDQILKFLKFKMADGRHVGKYSKCHISPTNGPTETQLGWSHPIMSLTCPTRFGCHGNGRCLATLHWTFSSYGRLEAKRVNQFWWNMVHHSKFKTSITVTWSNIKKIQIQDGVTAAMLENVGNAITRLPMDRSAQNLGGRIQPTTSP